MGDRSGFEESIDSGVLLVATEGFMFPSGDSDASSVATARAGGFVVALNARDAPAARHRLFGECGTRSRIGEAFRVDRPSEELSQQPTDQIALRH